jgi:predicted PurR-regulated permease PerM
MHDLMVAYSIIHKPVLRLQTTHIHAVCHFALLFVVVCVALYWLQHVLLPVLVAAGAAVLLEPIVFLIVDPWVRIFRPRPALHGVLDETSGSMGVQLAASPTHRSSFGPLHSNGGSKVCGDERVIAAIFRNMWCVLSVSIAIGGLLAMLGCFAFWVIASVGSVDWNKYLHGKRLNMLRELLANYGVDDFEGAMRDAARFVVQSLGVEIIGSAMTIMRGFLLMILFLGFFLIDSALARSVGKEPWRPLQRKLLGQLATHVVAPSSPQDKESSVSVLMIKDDFLPLAATMMGKLRLQMRIYIRQKFYLSVLKAFLIGTVMALLKVDLWIVWTLMTFLLNFMPLGSAVSTCAPILFIVLDPSKTFLSIAICIVWPVFVHNFVGNVVEPRVFASLLNLHPITVLLALTFWTVWWGVMGALVCVPLTAILRVTLVEASSHPYTAPFIDLMEGRLPKTSPKAHQRTWPYRNQKFHLD